MSSTRCIKRDETLKRELEQVPRSVNTVWVDREGRVTSEDKSGRAAKRQCMDVAVDGQVAVEIDEAARDRWMEQIAKVKRESVGD